MEWINVFVIEEDKYVILGIILSTFLWKNPRFLNRLCGAEDRKFEKTQLFRKIGYKLYFFSLILLKLLRCKSI
jgi:hypothetical protein